ncbi:hypothetical protein [Nocardia brasiliensis]|uniref:hypothetical protein n=1 Tax=Nocardia brasiliensis TaxID=37326 RepID=UPI002456F4EA|nr:hypothetical protein [Nocardia brasiliensis]
MPAQRPGGGRERLAKTIAAGGGGQRTTGDRRRRIPKPAPALDDDRPAMHRHGDTKQQQGINFDLALLQYAREAVTYMGRRHPEEAGSESLAALIDQAVREKLTAWERKHSNGKALPTL